MVTYSAAREGACGTHDSSVGCAINILIRMNVNVARTLFSVDEAHCLPFVPPYFIVESIRLTKATALWSISRPRTQTPRNRGVVFLWLFSPRRRPLTLLAKFKVVSVLPNVRAKRVTTAGRQGPDWETVPRTPGPGPGGWPLALRLSEGLGRSQHRLPDCWW